MKYEILSLGLLSPGVIAAGSMSPNRQMREISAQKNQK